MSKEHAISPIDSAAAEEEVLLCGDPLPEGLAAPVDRSGWHLRSPAALLRACRPRQWMKNLLVLAAPGAGGVLAHSLVALHVALAFVSFCMLASCTYLLNDVSDREEDATNPRRRSRPLASGEVSVRVALAAALALAVGGLAVDALVSLELFVLGAGYLLLTSSYSLWWREVAVADIAAVAGCFVLRALAGGLAASVTVSRWFVIVTSFGALFVVTGKRYAELRSGAKEGSVRKSLHSYSEHYLRFVLGLAGAVATSAYCLWAFQRPRHDRLSWYELTIIPFVLWLLRYALLLDQGAGQAPEELVLRDPFLLTMSVVWIGLFSWGVYVAG